MIEATSIGSTSDSVNRHLNGVFMCILGDDYPASTSGKEILSFRYISI